MRLSCRHRRCPARKLGIVTELRCLAGRDIEVAAAMGTIVKFPDEGRIVRFGRPDVAEETATVIILPVIRIERHGDSAAAEPNRQPPARKGGRRRVRRR